MGKEWGISMPAKMSALRSVGNDSFTLTLSASRYAAYFSRTARQMLAFGMHVPLDEILT